MIALLIYLFSGLCLSFALLPEQRLPVKIWLGLVFGCTELMWLPCLWAFAFGFTMTAQLAALLLAVLAALFCYPRIQKAAGTYTALDRLGFVLSLLALLFCAYLLHTHVLKPGEDGSLWVGQSTYGDLAMHLSFVESLYQQGAFPPEYSIYPGQQLNYPFLVDAASASLRFFGLSLRMAVIVPSLALLFCVFYGFWLLAERLCRKLLPSLLAWLLFVCNGGLGFALFLGGYPFSAIFTGYYTTPTNFSSEDIRWSNVICDMLIPQRTTMAGWCLLLAAIFLLLAALDKTMQGGGRREFCVLAVLAGTMPMAHTHSFLALGILSAVWFFAVLPAAIRRGRGGRLFANYVCYGLICFALAAPQFFKWTMDSVRTGRLLQWHLGWVAGANGQLNNWFWFYTVNVGLVFVLMWALPFVLKGEKRAAFLGAAAIFALANLIAFQPNLYDNNKLLYVWYMLADILVCDWLCAALERLEYRRLRAGLLALFVFLGVFSGLLTMARESISRYRLFSPAQVEAAAYIEENTEPDALFLTATNHNNAVSSLAGRSILCGPGLYLYFHGVDYAAREAQIPALYQGGEDFLKGAREYGIDYVYLGEYELGQYEVNTAWFDEYCTLVYEQNGVRLYRVGEQQEP